MLSGTVTRRYTQGLYAAAKDEKTITAVDVSLHLLVQTMQEIPRLRTLLEHPVIHPAAKLNVLRNVFGAHLHPLVERFVAVALERKRAPYLGAVATEFHRQADAAKGRTEVLVESALPLTPAQVQRLAEQLSKVLQQQATPIITVQPELIAGFRVRVGNRVMDATVRGALKQFEARLAARGAEEGTH
ncbi:ATP synthase F1 subunit delta [Alicyclobacillaceae bacterium I2511]|nr:ATP synthase F1 subunit delta [Alicyclobacillaceae bacterium I2511]